MRILLLLLKNFFSIKFRYLLYGSIVIVEKGSTLSVGKNVKIIKSIVHISDNSDMTIGNSTQLYKSIIRTYLNTSTMANNKCSRIKFLVGLSNYFSKCYVELRGDCIIGDNNIFESLYENFKLSFLLSGNTTIGSFNRIRAVLWTRFNASLTIGDRNAINQRTEIRADEKVVIGNYNQISYDCVIWDTNTHNIYPAEKRRELTDKCYPQFGIEHERPFTKPVIIGNDCWLGQNVAILKGSILSDKCIVAFRTTIVGGFYEPNTTIMNQSLIRTKKNDI